MPALVNQSSPRAFRRLCGVLLLCAPWTQTTAQVVDLMKVYELAVSNDPSFLSSGAENRAAQESPTIARADLLPVITGDLSSAYNITETKSQSAAFATTGALTNKFNTHDYNIRLTQPLYRKDRWIALDQSRVEVEQADATFAFERQALMLRSAQRYFDVLRAADTLTFTLAERDAFGQQLEQSQQRFEVGLIAITDVEEAKAGFDLARAEVIQAEDALDNAREALREISGEYHDSVATLGTTMPLEMPEPNDIDKWTEVALQQNLQLAGQRYAADRSRMEIKRIEAGHLPTLDLVGLHGRNVANGNSSSRSRADVINNVVTIQLNVPIYSGGATVARTRQSRHLYQRDINEVERVRRSVQRQTRDSFLGVRSGISRVNALAQAVKSNEAAANAIEAGFQVGTRTTVDVLNAKRDLFRAKRDFAESRYLYVIDILTLKQAAGTLQEDDLRLVDSWLN
ncbi:MAG: outer membrane protein [Gammaproteobacteria bacterium]|jgi:outer membrane protein